MTAGVFVVSVAKSDRFRLVYLALCKFVLRTRVASIIQNFRLVEMFTRSQFKKQADRWGLRGSKSLRLAKVLLRIRFRQEGPILMFSASHFLLDMAPGIK